MNQNKKKELIYFWLFRKFYKKFRGCQKAYCAYQTLKKKKTRERHKGKRVIEVLKEKDNAEILLISYKSIISAEIDL